MDQNRIENYNENPQAEKIIIIKKREDKEIKQPEESEFYKSSNAFYRKNRYAVIGLIIGIMIAILFITVGFFETLLILLLAFIGYLIGAYKDNNLQVIRWLNNLLRR